MPPLAINEFSGALGELAAKSGEAASSLMSRIGSLAPDEARAFVTDAYPVLLDPFLSASGELTAAWYAEQPTAAPLAKGAAAFIPTPALLPPADQLAISARWALTQNDALTALRGSAVRSTMNASRDTVVDNAALEGVKWVRHAQPNACGFCKMLATRTGGYSGRNVKLNQKTGKLELRVSGRVRGTRSTGQKYHDHCRCTAVPLRDGVYEPPDYVQQWTEEYNAAFTPGMKLTDIARALDAGRIRPDRAAAKLAKGLPDLATEAARLREIAQATLPPPAPVGAPANGISDVLNTPADPVEEITSRAMSALEAGDEQLADQLFGEALKLERAQQVKVEQAAKRAAKREVVDRAKQDEIFQLVEQGWRPDEAEAQVYGRSLDSIRRRDFIALARASGHSGAGFDELVTRMHAEFSAEQYWRAEGELRSAGSIKPQYYGRYKSTDLWLVNDATARRIMTEEMAAWFDLNGGRVTKSVYRQSILDGSSVFDVSMQADYLR